jgi:NACHT domain
MWLVVSPTITARLTTSISSAVIEEIRTLCHEGLASIGYFYFDFRDEDKRNHRSLLRSFLFQLSGQSNICCDILSRLQSTHRDDTATIGDDALTRCLKEMLSVTSELEHPVYLIMDALDECPNTSGLPSPREQVLELVKELVELCLRNLHICVTSRPEADIRATLEPLTSLGISLHDETGQKEDIIDYVTSVVYSDVNMQSWRDEDKKLVIETLCKKADGMYVHRFPYPRYILIY